MIAISFNVDSMEVDRFAAEFEGEMEVGVLAGVEEEARVVNDKIRDYTPEYLGRLAACIGEFDESFLQGGAEADPADAVFWVGRTGAGEYGAIVGTNVPYAKAVNDGFTVGPNQYAHFEEDGKRVLRRLLPGAFYEGIFMFEKGAEEARGDFQKIMMGYVSNAILGATKLVRTTASGRIRAYTQRGRQKRIITKGGRS